MFTVGAVMVRVLWQPQGGERWHSSARKSSFSSTLEFEATNSHDSLQETGSADGRERHPEQHKHCHQEELPRCLQCSTGNFCHAQTKITVRLLSTILPKATLLYVHEHCAVVASTKTLVSQAHRVLALPSLPIAATLPSLILLLMSKKCQIPPFSPVQEM